MVSRSELSSTQWIALMGRSLTYRKAHDGARILPQTMEVLDRHGLIEYPYLDEYPHKRLHGWKRTQAGLDLIKSACDKSDQRLVSQYGDSLMIRSTAEFLIMHNKYVNRSRVVHPVQIDHPDISLYIYGGQQPLLVVDGNGQQPIGVLSHYLMWQIEVGKSFTSEFIAFAIPDPFRYCSISGHKGSYGYNIDHQSINRMASVCTINSGVHGIVQNPIQTHIRQYPGVHNV